MSGTASYCYAYGKMFSKETIRNLPNNNRFYILVFSFLASIFAVCWLRTQNIDDKLYYIQVEQVFGFLAVGFLYVTLLISPVQKIIGESEWMKNVVFARRATGVLVFYFALLHAIVSLYGQIGGWDGLGALPGRFTWALIISATALVILAVLAATSFDKVLVWMTFPRWKLLQRLVYVCGILIIIHVWMIGAHFSTPSIQITGLVALLVLFGLQSWRTSSFLVERYQLSMAKKYLLFGVFWVAWALVLGLVSFTRPAQAHMFSKDTMAGSGSVLHITPDDDPIAGEQASLVFDIKDLSAAGKQAVAKLTITDDQNKEAIVPAHVRDNTVAAEYTFPRQGLYKIALSIEQDDIQTHHFAQSQRVNRGIISSVTVMNSPPLWAVVGATSAGVAAMGVVFAAFIRRKAINNYSKL